MVVRAVSDGDAGVEADARRIGQYSDIEAVAGAQRPKRASYPHQKPITTTIDRNALASMKSDQPPLVETAGVLAAVAKALLAVAGGGSTDSSADVVDTAAAAAAAVEAGAAATAASAAVAAAGDAAAKAGALSAAAAELASRIFVTVYMGTVNSSRETQERWEPGIKLSGSCSTSVVPGQIGAGF